MPVIEERLLVPFFFPDIVQGYFFMFTVGMSDNHILFEDIDLFNGALPFIAGPV